MTQDEASPTVIETPAPLRVRIRHAFPRIAPFGWLAVILAWSAFQFFVNSDDWRHSGIMGSDGQAYYAFIRSIVIDHDLDFLNEFDAYNYSGHGRSDLLAFSRSPRTGLLFNRFPIGYSIFLAPFFLIAHFLTLLGNSLNLWNLRPDGYTLLYQFATPLCAIFWAALAYLSTHRVLRRYFSPNVAASATLVLFLSFQGQFNAIWFWCNPHMPALLVFNLLLLTAYRVEDRRDTALTWAALGALTGLGALLRTESLAIALLPLMLFFHRAQEPAAGAARGRRYRSQIPPDTHATILRALAAPAACALVFFPQLLIWRLMWGQWFHVPMNNASEGFNWTEPVFLKILFSTRHGLFYWSPVLLIGFIGLLRFLKSGRAGIAIRIAFFQLLVLYYIYACWSIWWMGYSFGARQFIVMTPLFALGLAWIFERYRGHKRILIGLSILLIAWNQSMLWMFLNAHIPRSEAFPPLLPLQKFLEIAGRFL